MLSTPVIKGMEEIGPYQVLEDLGPAPFGTAYLAADTRSDRTVLLKVIPPSRPGSWQEAASWEILLAETEALGRLYHRGLPSLLEIAEHEGVLVVAFTRAEGRSLHEMLAVGERPDRATLVDWGCQLLDALAEAHGHGILHRHLTEEEVIVTPEGRLVLTGFGLTQLVFDPLVAPPPEQLSGELYTPQSDLYAVGSLLRRLAFAAGALRGGRASLGARDPLLKVLARATFTDPAARFESAVDMADALREAGRLEVPRSRDRSTQAVAPVASFPGTSLRLVTSQPAGASADPESENGDLWRVLMLLVASLLLMSFVLATGWFLLGRDGSARPSVRPAAASSSAPLASPVPPAAASTEP